MVDQQWAFILQSEVRPLIDKDEFVAKLRRIADTMEKETDSEVLVFFNSDEGMSVTGTTMDKFIELHKQMEIDIDALSRP